ncbi:type II toxin-antitoxin system prevent-host-death family antitoxin [Prosthecochloris sp.]|uniref:type II toxin-antitoxin system Phd/YefM family antitoxin n=1 Tax=Prosthecochloris sp. TaxID=290513 RepID=UPI0025CEC2AB|nr:type II toxin-antitoxin system prevent-host-death family antitoxin [Prosthecochloris sp.]
METIAVSELLANLKNVMRRVERGETLEITSMGKVIARLVPPEGEQQEARRKLKEIARTASLHDVFSPLGEEWEAEKQKSFSKRM